MAHLGLKKIGPVSFLNNLEKRVRAEQTVTITLDPKGKISRSEFLHWANECVFMAKQDGNTYTLSLPKAEPKKEAVKAAPVVQQLVERVEVIDPNEEANLARIRAVKPDYQLPGSK